MAAEGASRGRFGPKAEAAAVAMAGGATVAAAAAQAGCGLRTLKGWLAGGLRQRVAELRADLTAAAAGRLASALAAAIDTLVELLGCDKAGTRAVAARSIIDSAARMREQSEFEARLAAIEQRLASRGKQR